MPLAYQAARRLTICAPVAICICQRQQVRVFFMKIIVGKQRNYCFNHFKALHSGTIVYTFARGTRPEKIMNCFHRILYILFAAMLVSSCDVAFLDDIYDDRENIPDDTAVGSFANVDATSYATWVYIDLKNAATTVLDYNDTDNMPEEWLFAMHRHDCKTNGCGVMETEFTSVDELQSAIDNGLFTRPDVSAYTEDTGGRIVVDMSEVMSGIIGYADAKLNTELCKWLSMDMSSLPPDYTLSGKVYLLRQRDETVSAVCFTGYTNPYYYDTRGYISFDYIYSIEF